MQSTAHTLPAHEAETITDVDDSVAGDRGDVLPLAGLGGDSLQTPLGGEEERKGADISVLVLPNFGGEVVGGRVVEEHEVGFCGGVGLVSFCEGLGGIELLGETGEDRERDFVAGGGEVLEEVEVGLDVLGEVVVLRGGVLQLISGELYGESV